MSKPFYNGFSNHCLRFYARNPEADLQRLAEVDRENWLACERVLNALSASDREILLDLYSSGCEFAGYVQHVGASLGVEPARIWNLLQRTSRAIARDRGLI